MIHQSEIDWYMEIMPDLKVVFDVGCRNDNIFKELNPELEVYAFDPRPSTVPGAHQIALSDRIGTADFYPEYSSMHRRELKGEKWEWITHKKIQVPTDTIDNFCSKFDIRQIDLLKIDTEGNDLYVLLGAVNMLPYIKYIQFEHWSEDSTAAIRKLLPDFNIELLGGKPPNFKCW